jgi:hypothetical protein
MHINEVGELLGCNRNRFYFIDIDNDTLKLGSYIFRHKNAPLPYIPIIKNAYGWATIEAFSNSETVFYMPQI